MKKRVTVLTVLGLVFLVVGIGLFATLPLFMPGSYYSTQEVIGNLLPTLQGMFAAPIAIAAWVAIGIAGLTVLLALVHFIMICANKRPGGLRVFFPWIIMGALMALLALLTLKNGYFTTPSGLDLGNLASIGFIGITIRELVANFSASGVCAIVVILCLVVAVIGFILGLIGEISDMVYVASSPKAPKRKYAKDTAEENNVVVVSEDADAPAPSSDEIRAIMHQEMEEAKAGKSASEESPKKEDRPPFHGPEFAGPMGGAGSAVSGPLLVQYINTYSPAASNRPEEKGDVPLSEIKGNITGEKPLTAEDIRKIVKEELGEKKEQTQPVIVTVPAPAQKKEEPKPVEEAKPSLTAEDIRAIIKSELEAAAPAPKEEEPEEIVVEQEPAPSLSAEEIRAIIAEELAANKPEEKEEEPVDVKALVREALEERDEAKKKAEEEAAAKAAEEARKKAEEEEAKKKAEEEAAAKAEEEARKKAEEEEAKKAALTAEDVRSIIAEELAKQPKEEEKPSLTADDIRAIIAEAFASQAAASPVEAHEEEPAEEPAPAPAEEVVVPEAPAKRKVGEFNPNLPPHDKIIRIPFPTRMLSAEQELQSNYNELKAEALSYGAKSRVSNSGDTFRLHKVTFFKMTIAGKGLKLYMALDPKDYANSTIPVQDAGNKGTYKDIPLVFKVRSELSMRRAKQLIGEVMEKNGLEQGKIEPKNWAASLKDYKPTGAKDDEE